MKTFKAKNFIRNYECTNIKYIRCLQLPKEYYSDQWQECADSEIYKDHCAKLWEEDEKELYGYL